MSNNKNFPRNLPLGPKVGPRLGSGKDNLVHALLAVDLDTGQQIDAGYVVKVNHKPSEIDRARLAENGLDRVKAEGGVRYKKHKYDILRHFLGEYVPETAFVLTQEGREGSQRYVEMTLQQRVPDRTLASLNEDQKRDPRLFENVSSLVSRLRYMYQVLGEVNARVSQSAQLDAKLDLGGISSTVRDNGIDYRYTDEEIVDLIKTNNSPNLLVDPETMNLYCVDFDEGQWREGMNSAKDMAFAIDSRHKASQVGGMALTV